MSFGVVCKFIVNWCFSLISKFKSGAKYGLYKSFKLIYYDSKFTPKCPQFIFSKIEFVKYCGEIKTLKVSLSDGLKTAVALNMVLRISSLVFAKK